MKDTVWRCGHASHLMDEVNNVQDAPQIHLHWLTPDSDPEPKVEFCCHGCGASLTIQYQRSSKSNRHVEMKKEFVREHEDCPNRGYEHYCPNMRSSFVVMDLRPKPKVIPPLTRKMPAISLLPASGAGQSRNARRAAEGTRRRG